MAAKERKERRDIFLFEWLSLVQKASGWWEWRGE